MPFLSGFFCFLCIFGKCKDEHTKLLPIDIMALPVGVGAIL